MNPRLLPQDDPSIPKSRHHTSARSMLQKRENRDRGMSIPSCLVGTQCWPMHDVHQQGKKKGKKTHVVLCDADRTVVNTAWKGFPMALFSAEIIIITNM